MKPEDIYIIQEQIKGFNRLKRTLWTGLIPGSVFLSIVFIFKSEVFIYSLLCCVLTLTYIAYIIYWKPVSLLKKDLLFQETKSILVTVIDIRTKDSILILATNPKLEIDQFDLENVGITKSQLSKGSQLHITFAKYSRLILGLTIV